MRRYNQANLKNAMLFFIMAFTFFSCADKDFDDVDVSDDISFKVPSNFPAPHYDFMDNEVTNERFALGRKLFYDPILSRDNTISCGSCHQQAGAFAHIDHKLSHGIDGLLGTRNSPVIYNLAWHSNFFWDGGVTHIELQPINPITNPVEMDETIANVVDKLRKNTEYPDLFKAAYGSDSITSQAMLRALAQFMAVMVSADSRYDKYMRGESGGDLNQSELNGLQIFRQKCESCHREPLFTDLSFRNNGLDSVFTDLGRATITLDPNDEGKFKVPSLRNVSVSFPYMHDGRHETLSEVLDHYTTGIMHSATLDQSLVGGISMSPQERTDLLKFLETLTDHSFLTDSRFSEDSVR
jgi:cytochrome c peroxidase